MVKFGDHPTHISLLDICRSMVWFPFFSELPTQDYFSHIHFLKYPFPLQIVEL
jgi:hypothetical protein